jgi:dihydroorotate dehydrogenase (fumarate)
MDLSTTYLGFRLPHPFVPGAGPLADDLDGVRRLEDAGAPMIVLRSLFEEQLAYEQIAAQEGIDVHAEAFAEALSYLPEPDQFRFGPESYVDHLRKVKAAVGVPVVASLNGVTPGGWVEYARLLEWAGADAIELNLFLVATDPDEAGEQIERALIQLVRSVREAVHVPIAVKISPFYTALPHFARQLDLAGADGLVVFNRFYEPDIDVKDQQVQRTLHLSTSAELLPRLHALAVVSGRTGMSLAVTGGVHTGVDGLKAVMCGAHAVQVVSTLLLNGPSRLAVLRAELEQTLERHEYASLAQVCGTMTMTRAPNPKAFERVNYMQILQSWRG